MSMALPELKLKAIEYTASFHERCLTPPSPLKHMLILNCLVKCFTLFLSKGYELICKLNFCMQPNSSLQTKKGQPPILSGITNKDKVGTESYLMQENFGIFIKILSPSSYNGCLLWFFTISLPLPNKTKPLCLIPNTTSSSAAKSSFTTKLSNTTPKV